MNNVVYLSLGSDISDRIKYLTSALLKLSQLPYSKIVNISSFYKTEPYKMIDSDYFINICIEFHTLLTPQNLLKEIQSIEKSLGRISKGNMKPRQIDIDILVFNDLLLSSDTLTIPHRDMHNRKFVLVPLNEIKPNLVHPLFLVKIEQLLKDVNDNSHIEILA